MYDKYFTEIDLTPSETWLRLANQIIEQFKHKCEVTKSQAVPILLIEDYPGIIEPVDKIKQVLSKHFRIIISRPGEHVHYHIDANVQKQYTDFPKHTILPGVINFPIYGCGKNSTIWATPNQPISDPRIFYTNPEQAKTIKWKENASVVMDKKPVLLNTSRWHKVEPPKVERAILSFVCSPAYSWKDLSWIVNNQI